MRRGWRAASPGTHGRSGSPPFSRKGWQWSGAEARDHAEVGATLQALRPEEEEIERHDLEQEEPERRADRHADPEDDRADIGAEDVLDAQRRSRRDAAHPSDPVSLCRTISLRHHGVDPLAERIGGGGDG